MRTTTENSIKGLLRDLIREEVKAELQSRISLKDSTSMFLEENGYTQSATNFIPLQELYEDYQDYCYRNGNAICSDRAFRGRLTDLGYFSKKRSIGIVVFLEKGRCNKYLQRLYSSAFKVSNENLRNEILHNVKQYVAWKPRKK